MEDHERLRRPRLQRTGPDRSVASLAERMRTAPKSPPPASPAPERAAPEATDGPSGAVGLGYRVIEEYLRQGQQAARLLGFELPGRGAGGRAQDLPERLLRDGLLWLEHVAKVWSTLAPPGRAAQGTPAPASSRGAGDVRVRIASEAPAEVQVALGPDAAGRSLVAQDLRSLDPAAPTIGGVAITRDESDGVLRVDVRVPRGAPPTIYSGTIVDAELGTVHGTLVVRVDPAQEPA